jgi:hypothetical protein
MLGSSPTCNEDLLSYKHATRLRAETHSGVQARTRLRADLPTPAEAGFAKAGALQRAGTDTLFSNDLSE